MPDFLSHPVQQYLDQLASGAPTPGGGSAAGLTGAMGAALLAMSARFTVGREKYAAFQDAAADVLSQADTLRAALQQLMEDDATAYAQYGAALTLPKATEDERAARRQAIQEATKASARVPLAIAERSYRVLELAEILAANCNPNLVSDVVVATHLGLAAFRSAVINVRLNLRSLDDAALVADIEGTLNPLSRQAPSRALAAITIAYQAMNLPLSEGDLPL